ncbi:MAG: anaerobic ribonucleoside-triphosphate reductase [Candidatus Bathyarchaeia archaeon]
MSSQHQRLRGIRVLKAVSSAVRLQILNSLFDKGELSYTELMGLLKMSPSRDAGRFAYHLKFLLKADLVEVDVESKKYRLTDLGKMVLEVADEIEKKGLKPQKLLVRTSRYTLEEFDINRIVEALVKEANMPVEQAKKVAKEAEKRLLKAKTRYLTTPLIREVVNGILVEKGLEDYRHKLTRLGLPVHDVAHMLSKGKNFQNASSLCEKFGENVFEEYTLLNVLPRDVADAHLSGEIHISYLSHWILKPSEVIHDLRFFLENAGAIFFTKTTPKTLESALNLTFNMLLHVAKEVGGTQTLEYFNVFLAPFLRNLKPDQAKEALRLFMLNLSQHIDASLNLELTVPDFLAENPVISNSAWTGNYGDLVDECRLLALLTLEVLTEESVKRPLLNPRVVVKLRPENFKDYSASKILFAAHNLAAARGLPYFANNSGDGGKHSVFSPSGFRLRANPKDDWEIDTVRTGILGVVTVNLPRIVYECGENESRFFELLDSRLEMAARALEIKLKALKRNGKGFLSFLLKAVDGDEYFRLENSAHVVNLVGLEEAAEVFSGKNVYEDEDSLKFAVQTVQHISEFLQKREYERNKRLMASFVPFEEAHIRLARLDIERFGAAKVRFHGSREKPHYSAFTKVNIQNPSDMLKTLAAGKELYSPLVGGNLTVIDLGETEQTAETLLALTQKFVENYQMAFFTYSRNLTYCNKCCETMFGLLHKCPTCGSVSTLAHLTRYMC